jgi:hypothetical protein
MNRRAKATLAVITLNVVPTSLILYTLMMETIVLRNIGSYKSHKESHPKIRQFTGRHFGGLAALRYARTLIHISCECT